MPVAPVLARLAEVLGARGRWLALGAGLALPLGFAPFGHWWLTPLLLATLFLTWLGQSPRECFWRGFWFGFGAFATGTYWLYISIHGFGGAAPPFAIATLLALVSLMALYHGLCGWLAARLAPPGSRGWALLAVFPGAWTLVEWLRGWLLSGFPWLSLGFGQIDGPLAAWAPVAGVHGLTLGTVLLAGGLGGLATGGARIRWASLALVAAVLVTAGALAGRSWVSPAGETLRVTLVQGGIGQERKWLPEEREATLALYRDMTLALRDQDLVVWPEAAVPALSYEVEDYLEAVAELAKARDMQVLLGIVSYEPETERFYNSLLALGAAPGIYHKRHLVPFGEYFPVPAFVRDMLRLMNLPYQDITPGPRRQPLLEAGGTALGPSICYEDVFGAEVRDFLPAAGVLVNVSNDGWFGDSIAPHQHLQMARMRALETGRFLLRSTNTGISAVIGVDGRVVARGPQFQPASVAAVVQPYAGSTPWVVAGNGPVVGLALLLLVLPGLSRRRAPAGPGTAPR